MAHALARVPLQELASDAERFFDRVAQGESVIVVGQGGEELALVQPMRIRRKRRRKTVAALAAFRAAAGGWSDVDTDTLVQTLYDSRRRSSRPPVMQHFARIRGDLRRQGLLIGDLDLLIAATAIHYDLTLITRNLTHFQRAPDLKLHR